VNNPVGIRREDKNRFEARVPITPRDLKDLIEKTGARFIVQPSEIRVFSDEEYKKAGAEISEDISSCRLIFAVKEIPIDYFYKNHTYMFFSHTIKGQPYNMPMLKKMMELKCNLIDYEKVTDDQNRRLIFFGKYAGLAGMIDSLWALGKKFQAEGIETPFEGIEHAYRYSKLKDAENAISRVGEIIKENGIPLQLRPLITGFAGYGNVSRGAQEIYDLLPTEEISPDNIEKLFEEPENHKYKLYKVVFKEEDMVEPINPADNFELRDYYDHPEKYRSKFSKYLPYLTMLINCIYWDTMYPRLLTKEFAKKLYIEEQNPRLRVIGDISCDIEGAIELTVKSTEPDAPVYLYDIEREIAVDGFVGNGPIIMAVDNLPCELPKEASEEFSRALKPFIPAIINADFSKPFEEIDIPDEIKRAMILHKGELTPNFKFMEKFVQ